MPIGEFPAALIDAGKLHHASLIVVERSFEVPPKRYSNRIACFGLSFTYGKMRKAEQW